MHTDKDGVFVVEVARGIDSKQLAGDHPGVTLDATELPFDNKQLAPNGGHLLDKALPPSHEQVQIHAPPLDFASATGGPPAAPLHLIEEAEEHGAEDLTQQEVESQPILARTGLSQSDLSSTSSTDSNKRYSYGNQELYVIEQPGYATSSPTAKPILISPNQNENQNLGQERELKSQTSISPEQTEIDSSQGSKKSDEEVLPEKEIETLPEKEKETKPEKEVEITPTEEVQASPEKLVVPEKVTEVQTEDEKVVPIKEKEFSKKEEVPPPTVEVSPPQEDPVQIDLDEKPENTDKPDNPLEEQPESKPNPIETHSEPEKEIATATESQPEETEPEAESNYDSLMSLPAPPSTEEIKELGDYTLIESNQLDSLPPPPPPLLEAPSTPPASERQLISNGSGGGMGKGATNTVGGAAEEPATLTPPASPPATPPPSQTSTQYGSNGLTNGIHAMAVVDVNGS